ncbi:hypothetical protein AMECASPLE_030394 [Ameca splendens]|uniref:Uncharacterized protein n=1 Tax=Ameca splendens TaxID=208324 RepID=A0ABV0ZQV7_9TELE
MPQSASCLMSLALELDPISVRGFTPQPSHWFIQPEPAWLSSLPGLLSRGQPQLCVPATASADSPEDLDQSAIRLLTIGFFPINCLDHFLFWILNLIPRLRSGSWRLTVGDLSADPALLNKPFNLFYIVWLKFGSSSPWS